MQKLKKALVVSVMSMTVFSMAVVVAPEAQAASAGDLIKMDGLSSVYYLGADGKRYVFPNEATYFSWYGDFSSVVTIAQSELEGYPLGKNVTVRPGTKLIKITTDPKVYAVEPGGNLKHVADEATAKALWGDDWAMRVVDIADAFFTNYEVTGEQVSADAYPTGSLVKFGDSADVYYIDADGMARKVADEAAFVANRFMFDDVVTATIDMPTAGSDITGAEGTLTDTASGAGGQAGAGTGLSVSLSGDTAPSRNVPQQSTLVPFITVNLSASADGDVTVQSLTFTRKGTGQTNDFDGGYLYVGDERLTNKRSVNSSDHTISFNALNLTIPAGMTKAVTLKMNDSVSDTDTNNHYFTVDGAAHVSTNGAVVSGSFPLEGNTMAYASVSAAGVTFTGQPSNAERKIGETDVILGEFDIQNSSSDEDLSIYRIRLKQGHTASNDSVSNLSLDVDGTIVAEGVSMSDKYVDFMFESPFLLKKSKTVSATIRGDIVTDIDKYVSFYLKNDADVEVRGSSFGDFYGAGVTRSAFDDGSAFSESSVITIKGSEIDVSFDGPQAADTKDDTDDLVLANFMVKSNNLDVNMETLRVVLTTGGTANNKMLQNLELVDDTNNVSYSVADPASSTSANLDFENVYLTKGVQYNFEIRGDVQDNATAGATYSVGIDFSAATAYFQDADETAVSTTDFSASTLTGKTFTVAAPALVQSKVDTTDTSVVKDADGVLLYKGKLTATNVDDMKVTRIPVVFTMGDLTANTISMDWNRIYLYQVNGDGTETKLDEETSLAVNSTSASNSFNFSGFTLNVPKGTSNGVYFVIRGDAKSNPTGTTTQIKMGADSSWTVKDSDNNSVTPTVDDSNNGHTTTMLTEGTYTLSIDTEISELNSAQNVLAGGVRLIGRIKATAAKENAKIEDLVIQNSAWATNAGNDDLATLYLYDNKELSGTALASVDLDSSAYAWFQDINLEIPTTGSTYLYIGGLIKPVDYSDSPTADATADAESNIRLVIPADTGSYDTKVVGVDTGEVLTDAMVPTAFTATSTILGAVVSAIGTDFADATLANGQQKTIFSFTVTAPDSMNVDYDGDPLGVKLTDVVFSIATSGVDISAIKVERVSGSNGRKDATVTYSGSNMTLAFDTTYGTDTDLEVKPGETATYLLIADVANSNGSGDSISVIINNVDTDVTYEHNKGAAGSYTSDTSAVYPLIPGLTTVQKGSLSN